MISEMFFYEKHIGSDTTICIKGVNFFMYWCDTGNFEGNWKNTTLKR